MQIQITGCMFENMGRNMNTKSKVIVLPCEAYDEERIYTLMKNGLAQLGGLDNLINKVEKILLKPNLLKKAEVEKAVITHPVVVGAFARILHEEGYKNIVLADSCGHGTTKQVIQGTAECVISLSKMKTHALERITGAVKNSYGFVYGKNKAIGHTKYPSADSFARMLIDLNQYVKPRLYIMDGITAMEGNGPGSGDPVAMNLILMSTDPVALDSVFARLVYLKPEMVPTNYHGEKMGLGNCREENIEVVVVEENPSASAVCDEGSEITGREKQRQNAKVSVDKKQIGIDVVCNVISMEALIEKYGNPNFNVDRTKVRNNVWTKLAKALNIFQKKPYIEPDKCIRCGICVNSCPVPGKAVDFRNDKNNPPVYDYKKCIRCFCCQEMCPKKAIKVK